MLINEYLIVAGPGDRVGLLTVELTDLVAHRALLYASAVQRQGYLLTVEEFDAFVTQPDLKPPVGGRRVAKPRDPAAGFAGAIRGATGLRAVMDTVAGMQSIRLALAATPVEYEVVGGTPGESVREWLERLRWLTIDGGRVRVTPLGDAVLNHLEHASDETAMPVTLRLDQGDELGLARVVSTISNAGPCALVDPYFSFEGMLTVLESTQVERVLTGTNDKGKLSGIQVALAGLGELDRSFEVRKSDAFHDRFVVPKAGAVWMLGTSLTGVGKRLSMMVQLDEQPGGQAIRAEFERAWTNAEPVRPVGSDAAPGLADVEGDEAQGDAHGGDDDGAPS